MDPGGGLGGGGGGGGWNPCFVRNWRPLVPTRSNIDLCTTLQETERRSPS